MFEAAAGTVTASVTVVTVARATRGGREGVGPTGVAMVFGAPERPAHNPHVCGPVPGTDYMGGTLYRLPDPVLLLRAMKD